MVLQPIPAGSLPNQAIDMEAAQRLVDGVPKRFQSYVSLWVAPASRSYKQDGSFSEIPISFSKDEEGHEWTLFIGISGILQLKQTLTEAIARGLARAYYLERYQGQNAFVIDDIWDRRREGRGESPSTVENPTHEQRQSCTFWIDEIGKYERLFTYRAVEAEHHPHLKAAFVADVKAYWQRLEEDPALAEMIQFYLDIKDGKFCYLGPDGYEMRPPAPREGLKTVDLASDTFPDQEAQVEAAQKLLDSVPLPYRAYLHVRTAKETGIDRPWFGYQVMPVTFHYGDLGLVDEVCVGCETIQAMGWSLAQAFAKGIARTLFEDWPSGTNRRRIVAISNRRRDLPAEAQEDPFFPKWHGERLAAARWWCDEVSQYEHLFTFRALEAKRSPDLRPRFDADVKAYWERVAADSELGELIGLYRRIMDK